MIGNFIINITEMENNCLTTGLGKCVLINFLPFVYVMEQYQLTELVPRTQNVHVYIKIVET